MTAVRFLGAGLAVTAAVAVSGCTAIRENRGYIVDQTLVSSVQPGIDNKQSVEATLGEPSFVSQFGQPVWYYVSSVNSRRPFQRPRITEHQVLAVHFDAAGNVTAADRTGIDKVVYLRPDSAQTPTLGKERGFFEDLFGNIGAVGAGAPPGGAGPNTGPNGS
jgi:outer membrane protein assembly factor BamE (lipoprotein component of BamABCDE complex)